MKYKRCTDFEQNILSESAEKKVSKNWTPHQEI